MNKSIKTIEESIPEVSSNELSTIELTIEDKGFYTNLKPSQIFESVSGGELQRGAVSKTMRHLLAIGFTKMEVSKMLQKRYQHVRNVAIEDVMKNS